MDEPQWIEEQSVLEIHSIQLEQHGGMSGVRDAGLRMPRASRNHRFLDGNKRTAAVVCELFLEINGHELIADDDAWFQAMIGLASGTTDETQFASWLRNHVAARE